jgi:predicted MFS family arabinose efflux permease
MRPAPVLFACLFAAQASLLTRSPVMAEMARELGLSLATVGQLGTAAGVAGAWSAVAITAAGSRLRVRRLLVGGRVMLAGGSAATAAAPGFAWLLAAQLALGAGVSAVLAGGIAAVAAWAPPGQRASVLAWALVGQPAAWVAGMPVVGAVAHRDWRLAWLAVPCVASVVAIGLVVLGRPAGKDVAGPAGAPGSRLAWRRPAVRAWALGEVLGFLAWNGTLLYAGGLLATSYGLAAGTIGIVLGACAAAYMPAVWVARRHVTARPRPMVAAACLAAAPLTAALGVLRTSVVVTAALLVSLMMLNSVRGLAGSSLGLDIAADRAVEMTGLRATAQQTGVLLGAALGGLALDAGGMAAMTMVFAVAFALAALPHVRALGSCAGDAAAAAARA